MGQSIVNTGVFTPGLIVLAFVMILSGILAVCVRPAASKRNLEAV